MEEIDFYDLTDLSEKKVGDRIGRLKLAEIASIKEGDKVFSSGDGNMYPAGLFIGIIKVKSDGNVIVEPGKKLNSLSFVQIIDWAPEKRGIDINVDPIFYD